MDLIQNDAIFFADLLQKGGTVMICGALAMQQDAEKVLNSICIEKNGISFAHYKTNGQIRTDCY